MNKPVDANAPLVAHQELYIAAPIAWVWALQSDIAAWPRWQPEITNVTLDGLPIAGVTFRWKAKGLPIVSALHTVDAPHQIGWTGNSPGMFAVHNWTLIAQGAGTRVMTAESLSGWLAHLLKRFDPTFLEKSLDAALQRLKAQAEATWDKANGTPAGESLPPTVDDPGRTAGHI